MICENSSPKTDIDFNDVLENIRLLLEYIKNSKQIQRKKQLPVKYDRPRECPICII